MNSDRIKNAIREALREEAEKIAADPDHNRARANMTLLFAGAQIRIDERLQGVTLDLSHTSKYYDLGRSIADRITL
jgi:hypothetical protein